MNSSHDTFIIYTHHILVQLSWRWELTYFMHNVYKQWQQYRHSAMECDHRIKSQTHVASAVITNHKRISS